MLEIVISGGWVMVPIILCSIVAAAIILERLWTLQPQRVVPRNLSRQVWSRLEEIIPERTNDHIFTVPSIGVVGSGVIFTRIQTFGAHEENVLLVASRDCIATSATMNDVVFSLSIDAVDS